MTAPHSRLYQLLDETGKVLQIVKGCANVSNRARLLCAATQAPVEVYDSEMRGKTTHRYVPEGNRTVLYKRGDGDAWAKYPLGKREGPRKSRRSKGLLSGLGLDANRTSKIISEMMPQNIVLEYLAQQCAGFCVVNRILPKTFLAQIEKEYTKMNQNEAIVSFVKAVRGEK